MNDSITMQDPNESLVQGIVGTSGALLATIISVLPQIETWLRISTLVVGLSIGLNTIRLVMIKPKHRNKHKKDE